MSISGPAQGQSLASMAHLMPIPTFGTADGPSIEGMPGTFKAQKRPVELQYVIAERRGSLKSLEGEVPYKKGAAIITGTKGEQWPIDSKTFESTYTRVSPTLARKKPIVVLAREMEPPFAVVLMSGAKHVVEERGYFLVQYTGPNDCAAVRGDIFAETYMRV